MAVSKTFLPTLKEWQELIAYNPETGIFTWKPRQGMNFWNAQRAGLEAGSRKSGRYVRINIGGNVFLAHRLAWLFITGSYPSQEIDHINGNKFDNRACNLRDVPHAANKRNLPRNSANTSGVTGVYRIKTSGRWYAQIRTKDGINKHIGNFNTLEEAAAARKEAEKRYGFHPNHGRPPEPKQEAFL